MKDLGLTEELRLKRVGLSVEEESRIPGVEVKFVDIGRNTSSESGFLIDH